MIRTALRLIHGGRSRRVLLERLNQMETEMQPHVEAETEPTQAQRAMIEALNWTGFDLRLAAALNFMEVARAQGGQRDWTDQHAAQIRAMMGIGDAVVAGDASAIVPSGFGEPVRTRQAEALRQAILAAQRVLPPATQLDVVKAADEASS